MFFMANEQHETREEREGERERVFATYLIWKGNREDVVVVDDDDVSAAAAGAAKRVVAAEERVSG